RKACRSRCSSCRPRTRPGRRIASPRVVAALTSGAETLSRSSTAELRLNARTAIAGVAATAPLARGRAPIEGWTWVAVWVVLVPFLLALERMRSLGAALSVGLVASVAFAAQLAGCVRA